MKNKKIKRASLINLVAGYLMMSFFVVLIVAGSPPDAVVAVEHIEDVPETLVENIGDVDVEPEPVILDPEGREIVYVDRGFVRDGDIGLDLARNHLVVSDGIDIVRDRTITNLGNNHDGNIYIDNDRGVGIIRGADDTIHSRANGGRRHNDDVVVDRNRPINHGDDYVRVNEDYDAGVLDRRLENLSDNNILSDDDKYGIDGQDLGNLTIDDGEDEDISIESFTNEDGFGPEGLVEDKGDLYAYNYPSQGVGAGIGNAGVGAAVGFAGIGAGIGEAVLNGKTVPALGGIGSASPTPINMKVTPENDKDKDGLPASVEAQLGTNPNNSDTDGDGIKDGDEVSSYSNPLDKGSTPSDPGSSPLPQIGGVGGLMSGAGAGVAAGLVTGTIKEKLGLGVGCEEHGAGCNGGHGGHGKHEYDLPPDGALHIMMHVDGSGSILDTRKQLEIMKDTLLKNALLPYYNNDESLYNRRVTIIDGNGERTLQFFTQATKVANVLALVFQDEAAPAYHLPTFNKKPQDHYAKDLQKLKAELNQYGGLYRGVMFQVDRGKTFAKSFKEFVECAWQGTGYLENSNLKKYYWQENKRNIKHKEGVVFSDEYHAKDSGDPQYYLELIMGASRKVGLDLREKGSGLTDGKQNDR
jgi:hypothetical protein